MSFIKLTMFNSATGKQVYLNSNQIVRMEVSISEDSTWIMLSGGIECKVRETPKEIVLLINSSETKANFDDYSAVVRFAKWLHENNGGHLDIGKPYLRAVDRYIMECDSKDKQD